MAVIVAASPTHKMVHARPTVHVVETCSDRSSYIVYNLTIKQRAI